MKHHPNLSDAENEQLDLLFVFVQSLLQVGPFGQVSHTVAGTLLQSLYFNFCIGCLTRGDDDRAERARATMRRAAVYLTSLADAPPDQVARVAEFLSTVDGDRPQ